jgi:hypothetical protein
VFAHPVRASLLKRWLSQVPVVQEHGTTVAETVTLEATEEGLYSLLVLCFVAAGLQYLDPEHVVPEGIKTEKVLQKTAPVAAALGVAGK